MLLPFSKNKLYFKPGLLLTGIIACMFVLFSSLGLWQIERAEVKKVLAEQISLRISQKTLLINSDNINQLLDSNIVHRTIEVSGQFETQEQFLVDNKKHNGRAGYHVITPFKIHNTQQRILVNRGWIDSGGNRQILPEVLTPTEKVTLFGQISDPVMSGFRPGISQPADDLGGVWLYIDLNFFNKLSDTPLVPYILLLSKDNPYGFVRDWPEFKANTEMHIGYSIQWFAFAVFSLLAYFSLGIKKT